MFCPVCRSEYRRGIETCGTCDVELVPELRSGTAPADLEAVESAASVGTDETMVVYCGFLSLDEARHARETLRREEVLSEILIRDAASGERGAQPEEEYWLRVPAAMFRAVERVLGEREQDEPGRSGEEQDDAVACSDCGKPVAQDESACPHCGAQFE